MFLFLVGKFCSIAVFMIVYIFTCELYPTPVRTQAAGICSLVGKVAGIATYLLDLIKPFWMPGPLVIMGYVDTKSKYIDTLTYTVSVTALYTHRFVIKPRVLALDFEKSIT